MDLSALLLTRSQAATAINYESCTCLRHIITPIKRHVLLLLQYVHSFSLCVVSSHLFDHSVLYETFLSKMLYPPFFTEIASATVMTFCCAV